MKLIKIKHKECILQIKNKKFMKNLMILSLKLIKIQINGLNKKNKIQILLEEKYHLQNYHHHHPYS